jgi:hypothetical protein
VILAKQRWKINTAFVECLNLDFRQHVTVIGRRVNTLCKHEAKLRYPLALFHVYHNCGLPHVSLPLSLPSSMRSLRGEQSSVGSHGRPRWPRA